MADYLGDYPVGGQVYYPDTFFASGVAMNLISGALAVYKRGTITESVTGITLTMPYDSRSGFFAVDIDTTVDSAFYVAGAECACMITAGTLDGAPQTPRTLFRFSIERTGGSLALLKAWLTGGLLLDNLVGPLVTVVAGANTTTSFKIDLGGLPANGPKDAWLSFDRTTPTVELRGQTKRVSAFDTTTDFITVSDAYTTAPAAGDTARLVTR